MRYATRRPALALLMVAAACGGRPAGSPEPAADSGKAVGHAIRSTAEDILAWRVETLNTEGRFRAAGFGRGDTVWGLDRGRVAYLVGSAAPVRLGHTAWDVQVRRGEPTWLDESGLWSRSESGPALLVARSAGPADQLGPDVLWSPDGRAALLTWTGEGSVTNGVLENGAVRWLHASMPGLGGASAAMWLDDRRVILPVTRWSPLAGEPEHRESGYRADLALLDVVADSIRVLTSARDGEWLAPAGVLIPDGILAGVRTGGGVPQRHLAVDTARWIVKEHGIGAGRALADLLSVAVLRPESAPGAGGEPAWRLDITGVGDTTGILRLQGHSVRTIWYGHTVPRLLVVQESETGGNRAWILRSYVIDPSRS